MAIHKIISGGQTGADRAALDWAIARGIEHGGWCPAGRRAEDGAIPGTYRLLETESCGFLQRTRRNIADADATLVVNLGTLEGGTLRTVQLAQRLGKPVLVIFADIESPQAAAIRPRNWVARVAPIVLNVAGPRTSKRSGIYQATWRLLGELVPGRDE